MCSEAQLPVQRRQCRELREGRESRSGVSGTEIWTPRSLRPLHFSVAPPLPQSACALSAGPRRASKRGLLTPTRLPQPSLLAERSETPAFRITEALQWDHG